MKIIKLTKDIILKYQTDILEMDSQIFDDRWIIENFTSDYPQKWNYSIGILENNHMVGILIATQKNDNLHIHRLLISKEYQNLGYGSILLTCLKGLYRGTIDTNVRKINIGAINFYITKNSFRFISEEDSDYVLEYKR